GIDDRELDAGAAERECDRTTEASSSDDRRSRGHQAALLPHTLHLPSAPSTPTHAPSGQSLRSAHSGSATSGASTGCSSGNSSSGSGSLSPRLRSSPQFCAARPHTLHVPSGPITPTHAPLEQSSR